MTWYTPNQWAKVQRREALRSLLRGRFREAWHVWKRRYGEPYRMDGT